MVVFRLGAGLLLVAGVLVLEAFPWAWKLALAKLQYALVLVPTQVLLPLMDVGAVVGQVVA